MKLNQYTNFYLVGIKGVAMTSLAQVLLDAGKTVRGSDTAEEFVTAGILTRLQARGVVIDLLFDQPIPEGTDCLVYTAAHKGQFNPQVVAAKAAGIPCYSQAEAIAAFFNEKKGVAVCGVGGKSTTSAMITWILEKTGHPPSFSVGVGKIIGLEQTGAWREESEFFVAEADEYVTDPSAPSRGEPITPRFSYMQPFVTVCTNYRYDHPDVYKTPADTAAAFNSFFKQIKAGGSLIVNYNDLETLPLEAISAKITTFGTTDQADFYIDQTKTTTREGSTTTSLYDSTGKKEYTLNLPLPGTYNLENAAYAVIACKMLGIDPADSCQALQSFQSTLRRFEKIGEKNGVLYFDDYGHHPNEVKSVIAALQSWYPNRRTVIAFQSHTYSRTKQLFTDFVDALATAREVVLLDIFASARESFDPSITSDMLVAAVREKYPRAEIQNLHSIPALAAYLTANMRPGDVCLTVGAGDIYKVHKLIH